MTRSAKLEQLQAAPPLYHIVLLLYYTPDLTSAVNARAAESENSLCGVFEALFLVGGIIENQNSDFVMA